MEAYKTTAVRYLNLVIPHFLLNNDLLRFSHSIEAFTFDLKDSDQGQWFRLSVCVGNSTMQGVDHVRRSAQQIDAQERLRIRNNFQPF